jgi:diguanylate cyclase (GGDEF)-like protein
LHDLRRFSDISGHATGDEGLRQPGSRLIHQVCGDDIACRYGDNEFILILPDVSPQMSPGRAE